MLCTVVHIAHCNVSQPKPELESEPKFVFEVASRNMSIGTEHSYLDRKAHQQTNLIPVYKIIDLFKPVYEQFY